MKKLISMTDFVLEQEKRLGLWGDTYKDFTEKTSKYAQFLKQPLTLGMFVPCGEDGKVLEHPDYIKKSQGVFHANHTVTFQSKQETTLGWYITQYDKVKRTCFI